jgi:GH15 family glucan-1,4-alpha-glucosidase
MKDVPYQPIENYGIIGNMRTAALVGMNGSVDWYCYPHFDSPSVFGAILDDEKGGRFQIQATGNSIRRKQFYWPNTNILVTRFLSADGIGEIEDFMPVGLPPDSPWYHKMFRRLKCVRGSMNFELECRPAFDYGRQEHVTELSSDGVVFKSQHLGMGLSTNVALNLDDRGGVRANFTLNAGETKVFCFKELEAGETGVPPSADQAQELFEATVRYWRQWLSSCTYRGRWREQVYRSALLLKLLTFDPTGAIIAAPTTSLPEVMGGVRNWDYRYTWLRDAGFTIYAFLRIGFTEEAKNFIHWLRDYAVRKVQSSAPAPAMFTIYGKLDLDEIVLSHWEGYRGSAPVRIRNDASKQFQNDIYGEVIDALYLSNKYVMQVSYDGWTKLRDKINWICESWTLPDNGIWEVRNRQRHFVYSKIMNWVALDRGIRMAMRRSLPADLDRWIKTRNTIYEEVMNRGWNPKVHAFTQTYDQPNLDASLLIMPLVLFMAPNDPRMLQTIDAIMKSPAEGGLFSDGLVNRYTPGEKSDGLAGEEGTFNICSFWLVEALTRAGATDPARLDQARLLFERMLGFANHLGLYSEQTGSQGEALGNFPQAFTHLALISAAFNLDRTLGNRP